MKEITLDMANSMKTIAKKCFPTAIQVTDRFHVQKLALKALQDIRIKHRWDAIDTENEQIKLARAKTRYLLQKNLAMEIQENNYWPGADIYYTKPLRTGQKANSKEARYYSINTLI